MRQFISEKNPDKKGVLILEGKDFKYLRQVLRIKTGDMLNVRLPDGNLQNFTVAKIDEKSRKITLQICAENTNSELNEISRGVNATELNEIRPVEFVLFQFVPKPQKFEIIVRQATECGVSKIIPVIGEYSEKNAVDSISGSKSERLKKIVREARQQSGSPVDTQINEPLTLQGAYEFWRELTREKNVAGFVLSERDDASDSISKLSAQNDEISIAAIAVGSEGGISPEEVKILCETFDFIPVHFKTNILRCETAALYGMAILQNALL